MINAFRCVVDTSVGIKQFIPDPLSIKVKQLFELLKLPNTEIFVPDLFYIKSTNVLWKYVRAGQYARTDFVRDLANLKGLSLQVFSTANLMEFAFEIAVSTGISAYDATYVALSDRVGVPLLTLDQKLIRALAATSYNVLYFADFSVPELPAI